MCEGEEKPEPPNILKNGKDEYAISELLESAGDCVLPTESPVKKKTLFRKPEMNWQKRLGKIIFNFFCLFLNKWSLSSENKLLIISLNASCNLHM